MHSRRSVFTNRLYLLVSFVNSSRLRNILKVKTIKENLLFSSLLFAHLPSFARPLLADCFRLAVLSSLLSGSYHRQLSGSYHRELSQGAIRQLSQAAIRQLSAVLSSRLRSRPLLEFERERVSQFTGSKSSASAAEPNDTRPIPVA